MKAFEIAAARPWAISEPWLRTILEIAARENPSIEAVEKELGRKLDNTRNVTTRNGVAVIPVNGPIFRYANLFSDISGGTSIQTLAKDFNVALNDGSVQAIVLDVNSPGGEVDGTSEMADMIRAGSAVKPVTAYVSHLGASAAYWLASAASRVVVSDTALVGSIGTVMAVRDPEKTNAKDIEFVSSQSPNKRPNPNSESGKSQIQSLVDSLTDVFVSKVAEYRGVSEETVLSDFGQGGMLVGQDAVDAGLADAVGSLEQVIAEARTPPRQMNIKQEKNTMASKDETPKDEQPTPDLKAVVEELQARIAGLSADSDALREAKAKLEAQLAAETAAKISAEADKYIAEQISAMRFNKESAALCRSLFVNAMAGEKITVDAVREFVASLPKLPSGKTEPAKVEEVSVDAAPTKADYEHRTADGDERIAKAAQKLQAAENISFAEAAAKVYARTIGEGTAVNG